MYIPLHKEAAFHWNAAETPFMDCMYYSISNIDHEDDANPELIPEPDLMRDEDEAMSSQLNI